MVQLYFLLSRCSISGGKVAPQTVFIKCHFYCACGWWIGLDGNETKENESRNISIPSVLKSLFDRTWSLNAVQYLLKSRDSRFSFVRLVLFLFVYFSSSPVFLFDYFLWFLSVTFVSDKFLLFQVFEKCWSRKENAAWNELIWIEMN